MSTHTHKERTNLHAIPQVISLNALKLIFLVAGLKLSWLIAGEAIKMSSGSGTLVPAQPYEEVEYILSFFLILEEEEEQRRKLGLDAIEGGT